MASLDGARCACPTEAMLAVAECWSRSADSRVRGYGGRLRAVLETRDRDAPMPVWTDPYGQRVAPPPDLQLGLREAAASAAEPAASVALALSRCDLAKFPWKEPKGLSPSYAACLGPGKMRSAMLVGDLRHGAVVESRECFAGLMWMEKGSSYPAHCHDANEMFQIVLGATSTWSRRADLSEPGAFAIPSCPYLHHGPRQPHAAVRCPALLGHHRESVLLGHCLQLPASVALSTTPTRHAN